MSINIERTIFSSTFLFSAALFSYKIFFRGVGVRTVLILGVLSSDHNALLAIAGNPTSKLSKI